VDELAIAMATFFHSSIKKPIDSLGLTSDKAGLGARFLRIVHHYLTVIRSDTLVSVFKQFITRHQH
jgi:hypothetical protein